MDSASQPDQSDPPEDDMAIVESGDEVVGKDESNQAVDMENKAITERGDIVGVNGGSNREVGNGV
ncbi:hypothetical protein Bca4012_020396 [Brassica carinata]|uniref:Uncharacterized protein n=1 Tax=Brassica carinata TaxID=52824 RepID=A0A8X8BDP7_BRACI|nr:hypothetical protein Bca52824_001237 [Brassica carinata]